MLSRNELEKELYSKKELHSRFCLTHCDHLQLLSQRLIGSSVGIHSQPTVGGGGSDAQVGRKHMKGSQAVSSTAAPAMAPETAFCPQFLGKHMVHTLLGACLYPFP